MRVRRVLVGHLVYVEESGIGNTLLAEGLEAIEGRGWEEPGRTDGDSSWGSRDLRGRGLMESFSQLLGCDKVGGEATTGDRLELGAGEGRWSAEGEGGPREERNGRHGVRREFLHGEHEEVKVSGVEEIGTLFWFVSFNPMQRVGGDLNLPRQK